MEDESNSFESEPDLVNCPHKKKGCEFKGTIDQLEEHIFICENTPYVCSQGCGKLIPPKSWGNHQKEECDCRIEYCGNVGCYETFLHKDLEGHNSQCEFFRVSCLYKCQLIVPRFQMKFHLKKCENRVFKCGFHTIGCTYQGTRKELENHENKAVGHHLSILTKQVTDQSVMMKELCATNCIVGKQINQNEKNVTFLESRIDKLDSDVLTEYEKREHDIAIRNKLQVEMKEISERLSAIDSAVHSAKEECTQEIMASNQILTEVVSEQKTVKEQLILFEQQNEELLQLKSDLNCLQETCQAHSVELEQQRCNIEQCREDNSYPIGSSLDDSTSCYYIWKLQEFTHVQQTTTSSKNYVLSDPFYSSQGGYNLCLCVCPKGNNSGSGTHLSCYLVVTQGSMDQILNWPIQCKVSFTLFDQLEGRNDRVKEFTVCLTNQNDKHDMTNENGSNKVFPRPKSNMNFGRGIAKFIRLKKLKPFYLVNDTLFLKAVVVFF